MLPCLQVDVRTLSQASCKIQLFVLYLSLDTSAWLLAVITIERYIAVCRPTKHRLIKPARVAFKIIGLLLSVQVVFNMHVFWTRGKNWEDPNDVNETDSSIINCGYTSHQSRYFWNVHQSWLSMLWYSIFPFLVMLILNIFIIKRLWKLKKSAKQKKLSNASFGSVSRQANSMTIMLLSITIYFMVIATPVFVFTMFQKSSLYAYGRVEADKLAKLELTDGIVTLLLYLNHSINFFLYCMTGRRFRLELKQMFCCMENIRKITVKKPSVQKGLAPNSKEMLSSEYLAVKSWDPSLQQNGNITTSVNISGL